jgi:prevent-host-death family protein
MGKTVGMAEFKANCTRLLREVGQGGEPITVTSRGKPVATITPPAKEVRPVDPKALFGFLKSPAYRFDWDPSEPAADLSDWEALR